MNKGDMNKVVLALDPSGNFNEGRGTTGWCMARGGYIFAAGQIASAEFNTQLEYWSAVIDLIYNANSLDKHTELTVVCEDYRLYASASEAQINSNLETPQLIGAIKWVCNQLNVKIVMQMASEVKSRWSNDVLFRKGLLKRRGRQLVFGDKLYVYNHSIDAIRHCLHYNTFKIKPKPYKTITRLERYDNYGD